MREEAENTVFLFLLIDDLLNMSTLTKCSTAYSISHSSTLAWRILWTEEPGRLQSMGSLRVGHD